MNIQAYLNRFRAELKEECSLLYLTHLQEQHLLHVPYENLDIINGKEIIIELNRFYDKIVEKERGGFCFELSGLFNELLQQLGFQTKLISGTVVRGEWIGEDCHAASIVTIDNIDYLVDVGYGDGPRRPLPLSGEVVTDVSGMYRVYPVAEQYDLQKNQGDQWITLYSFSPQYKQLTAFEDSCRYLQTSPDSPYRQGRIVTIATEQGRVTLWGNSLIITQDGIKNKKDFEEQQFLSILQTYFEIKSSSL